MENVINLQIFISFIFCKLVIKRKNSFLKMDVHISLAMMVKNEEKTILKSLESCKSIISSLYIFDTGSDDETLNIVKQFDNENPQIAVYIKQGDFVDFSISRNVLLEFVEENKHVQFVILLDSNDELRGPEILYKILEEESKKTLENTKYYSQGYLLRQRWFTGNGMDTYFNIRLIRGNCGWRYHAPVHEYIQNDSDPNSITTRIDAPEVFIYQDRTQDCESTNKRFQRDKEILLKEHFKNPTDARTLFYLAQTYGSLSMAKEAYYYYKLRVKYGGYEEERYHSFFRMGEIAKSMGMEDQVFIHWWIKAMECLHIPRVEPIIELATYYLFNNVKYDIAGIFTSYSKKLEYPTYCNLFINRIHYDYTRYQMDGITQYYLGNFEQGLDSCRKAIKYNEQLMTTVTPSMAELIKYKMKFDINNEKNYLEQIEKQGDKPQTNEKWYNYTGYELETCVLREYNHNLFYHQNNERYTIEKDTLIKTFNSTNNLELLYHIAMTCEKLQQYDDAYYYYKQYTEKIYEPTTLLKKQHLKERKQMHKELKEDQIINKIDTSELSEEDKNKLNTLDEHQIKKLNDLTNRQDNERKQIENELIIKHGEMLYNTYLRLGDVAKLMKKESSLSIAWWLKSLEVCTEPRIEALMKMANHYIFANTNYYLADMYLQKALSLPKPKVDKYKMFVNTLYYDYTRYASDGIVQYYLGDVKQRAGDLEQSMVNYRQGMESCQKGIDFCKYAIKKCIGNDNLKSKFMEKMKNDLKNMVYYTSKLKEIKELESASTSTSEEKNTPPKIEEINPQ